MWLTHKFSTLIQSDTNDTLSRKNSTYKKRGLSQPTSPPDIPPLKTLAIAVTGACNVGTSTLIQLGLQDSHQKQSPNTASCQRHPSIFTIKHIRYLVDRMETSASLIDATEDPPEPTESLADIHGGLICYDLNNPGSMECLPELLSVYVARNIPTYLVGLKTDLIEEGSSVNVQLGHQLADRFGVQLFQVDAHTEKGILDIRAMWASLVQQCIHRHTHPPPPTQTLTLRERRMASESSISITIDHKPILCKLQDEMKQRSAMTDPDSDDESPVSYSDYQFPPIDPPTSDPSLSLSPTSRTKAPAGFVYAPTALEDYPRGKDTYSRRSNLPTAVGLTAEERDLGTTPDGAVALSCKERLVLDGMHRKNSLPSSPHFSYQRGSASHDFNARRRGSAPQTALSNLANSRRGSKDSSYSDSYSNGMTVDAIVDRLLLSEPYRVDEHIIPIFITFFRKFMKPGDLVRMLVERFENDDLSSPPTPLQQRIYRIFVLWMSHYWGDFHSSQTRKTVITFIENISHYENMRPICDGLAPLAIREPPLEDPDAQWGLMDSDTDTDDFSDTPSTPKQHEKVKKKNSGYASESFKMPNFMTKTRPHSNPGIQYCSMDSTNNTNAHFSPTFLPVCSTPSIPQIPHESAQLKRTSSVGSLSNLFTRSRESSTSSIQFLTSLAYFKSMAFKQTTPSTVIDPILPPNSQASTDTNNKQQEEISFPHRRQQSSDPQKYEGSCRPEFSGGLINLDSYTSIPASASWASLSTQTLLSSTVSITSAMGRFSAVHDRSQKDHAAQSLKLFLNMMDKCVAEQLTWIEAEVFGKIKTREFVRSIWTSQCRRPTSISSDEQFNFRYERWAEERGSRKRRAQSSQQQAPSSAVVASISHFNFISAWVATSIVSQPKLNKRVALLEKFMFIAVELRNYNNYNSLMAILAGINNAAVLRLRQTREVVSNKKIYKQFQSLEKLMSTDRSFSSYRMALKASGTPGIPYLGIHNQDLVSLSEANKDFKTDGTIHWEKFRLMGESIMGMLKFQNTSYQNISPDQKILSFIADSCVMTEDEQYRRSHLIEPRLKSSSTNKLRDLWSRV